ncbi:MAG: hypothetical protein CME68_00605 [Halobacteriovoraceae bacterium]|nr:hypothetical protein [Halobacteriovoraceae bacterium]
MKKIGKELKNKMGNFSSLKTIVTLWVFLAFLGMKSSLVGAIEIGLTVDESTISLGEEFSIQIRIEGSQSVESLQIENADKFSLSNRGTSTSVQIINGKASTSKTINYSLYSKKEGSFKVGPVVALIDGKEYRSNVLNLKVLADAASANSNVNQGKGGSADETHKGPSKEKRDKNFLIEGFVNKKNPFVGEQIIYTFRLYYRVEISNPKVSLPKFKGFWKEELGEGRSYRKVIKGKEWRVYEVNYALFPTKPGKVNISESTFAGDIYIRDGSGRRRGSGSLFDMFDDPFFGGGFGRRKKVTLRTKELEIKAKPLLEEGKPDSFSGLVGDFKIVSRIDKDSLRQGESTTLTLSVQGSGNIFDAKIEEKDIPGFKIYKDKPVLKIQRNKNGVFGKRVFKMALVPQDVGNKQIPSFSLSYFDPKKGVYKVTSTRLLSVNILKAKSGDEENVNLVSSSQSPMKLKKKIKVEAKDLMPIKRNVEKTLGSLTVSEKSIVWITFLLSPLLFMISFFWQKKKERLKGNEALRRQEQALKKFNKGLKGVNEGSNFLTEASNVFRDYIGDKVNVDGKALTPLDLDRVLSPHQLGPETLKEIKSLLQDFESAQYGGQAKKGPREMMIKMKSIVKSMEKELR